jgi:Protein of unknown function (DUF2510)
MTSAPRAPDWYPDPSGKPGLMYWDGRQWHTDIPATSPPTDRPPPQSVSTTPQPQLHTAVITALSVAAVVLLGIIGVTGYLLLKRSHPVQTPTAQPPPVPAVTPVQAAPPPGQTQQPAPTSNAALTSQYFTTPSGKICQVTAQQVTCQSCIPGQVITNAYTCTDPAPTVAVNTEGIVDNNPPDMASPPDAQQMSDGQTYHANGWTIVASGGWARFINDMTGHGMAIAGQNRDSF